MRKQSFDSYAKRHLPDNRTCFLTKSFYLQLVVGLNSQIHTNRADSENWILFRLKTTQNIIFGRKFACLFASKMTIPGDSIFCNKFVKTFYVIECLQFYCYFQLAGIPSFQKRYTCSKKILNIKQLFKKMWSQIPLFSANFDFGAQLQYENFKIPHPNFGHVIYNLHPFQNAIFHPDRPTNG